MSEKIISLKEHEIIPFDEKLAIPKSSEEAALAASPAASSVLLLPVIDRRVEDELLISACLASEKRCQCYSHDGIYIDLSDQECRLSALQITKKFRRKLP